MQYLNIYTKKLDKKASLVVFLLFALLFVCYEYILLSRLFAERYLNLSLYIREEAGFMTDSPLVDKSLQYQKVLKLMKRSIRLNPFNSSAYFEYAEAISGIAKDPELRNSIDARSLGIKENSFSEYCDLARAKYTEAILREPTNGIYHQRLGDVFTKLSNIGNGEKEFNNALLLDPQNATIHLYLSGFYFSRSDQEPFLYHLNKAIDLGDEAVDGSVRDAVYGFLKSINRLDLLRSKYYKSK